MGEESNTICESARERHNDCMSGVSISYAGVRDIVCGFKVYVLEMLLMILLLSASSIQFHCMSCSQV